MPCLLSVCQSAHGQYGSAIVSQLLCWQTHWSPPKVNEHRIPQPTWFKMPPTQLRRCLSEINAKMIKSCCDLYLLPKPTPKSKTERYNLMSSFTLPAEPFGHWFCKQVCHPSPAAYSQSYSVLGTACGNPSQGRVQGWDLRTTNVAPNFRDCKQEEKIYSSWKTQHTCFQC